MKLTIKILERYLETLDQQFTTGFLIRQFCVKKKLISSLLEKMIQTGSVEKIDTDLYLYKKDAENE